MKDYELDKRRYVIAGVAIVIVTIYIIRLFTLQIMSDDYKKNADSNAFLKKVEFPSRGIIYDRNDKTLVYNQPSYDIMLIVNELRSRLDTVELCKALNITREYFLNRMRDIQDRSKNPGYSRFTQQLFMSQLSDQEFSVFQEKAYKFPGFYIQRRSIRQYEYPCAALLLGDVAEVSQSDIDDDKYYQPGDYIGKIGVERSYEKQLRGTKGVKILLRDNYGRIQGSYQNGKFDTKPIPGKKLKLGLDVELQRLGERLMEGKLGSIVAIEPATGEILCMVSAPAYDPRLMIGRQRGKNQTLMQKDPLKPLLNRAIMGMYPPGSTFKTGQALTFLTEGIIDSTTAYPCYRGFNTRGMHVKCHGHPSPLSLIPAIGTSCNGFFCWGLFYMLNNKKYPSLQAAMDIWRDYMVSMGFGYKLGIDLPGEKRGMIPNATYYDKAFKRNWNALGVISISIGQGEVTLTPLQIANLGATIANRGWYIPPHVVKEIEDEQLDTIYTHKKYTMATRSAYELVVKGMRRAVTAGTCRSANRRDYEVCGKTGTAQNSRGRDHSAFMGFAPMNNPQIAICVYVEHGGFGATFGVPIGALMMEQYIKGELSEGSKRQAARIQSQHIKYGTKDR